MPLPGGGSVQQSAFEGEFDFTRRFALSGPLYFALGASYKYYGFSDTAGGLPDRFQAIAGVVALQYIVQDHVAATVELRPGFYAGGADFGESFDMPVLAYVPIPLSFRTFSATRRTGFRIAETTRGAHWRADLADLR